MSLDVAKLEKVRELVGGIVQARCPACAEGGHDRAGEHLRIYPDGKFGCCVHPKDGPHRKRIWALAGLRERLPQSSPGTFSVRLKSSMALPPSTSVKAALFAGLNAGKVDSRTPQPLSTPQLLPTSPKGGNDSSNSLARLVEPNSGTLGTGNFNFKTYTKEEIVSIWDKDLETAVPSVPTFQPPLLPSAPPSVPTGLEGVNISNNSSDRLVTSNSGTLGTGKFNFKTYTKEEIISIWDMDLESGVPSVPNDPVLTTVERHPFLTAAGDLVIPFDSPVRFHWWNGGQSRDATLAEVLAAPTQY